MASTTQNQGRRLGELLQEQQEPFILDAYLSEKGCQKKMTYLSNNSRCCPSDNSGKILNRSTGNGFKQKLKGISMHWKLLISIYTKPIFINMKPRVRNFNGENRSNHDLVETYRYTCCPFQNIADEVRNSCASSVTYSEQSEDTKNERREKANTERHIPRECVEGSKQFSPVSVLDEISSLEDSCNEHALEHYENKQGKQSYTPRVLLPNDFRKELILSARAWKKVSQHNLQGLHELVRPTRQLKQTKQLLLDCVREVLDTHRQRKRVQRNNQDFLSCEEIGKLISESITAKERIIKEGKNSSRLIDSDILDSKVRWHGFETQKNEVALDIEGRLFKEIIDELVIDMISSNGNNL